MGSFLIVAGNKETTRVNVEALLEDYFRGNGKDFWLVLPFYDRPSQGQIWAHQLAHDLGIPSLVVAPENAMLIGLNSSDLHQSPDPITATVELTKTAEHGSAGFFLWSDEDPHTVALQTALKEASVPCYDLSLGLIEISAGTAITPSQKAPEPVKAVIEEDDLASRIAVKVADIVLAQLRDSGVIK
jgi:hypothetical protein